MVLMRMPRVNVRADEWVAVARGGTRCDVVLPMAREDENAEESPTELAVLAVLQIDAGVFPREEA